MGCSRGPSQPSFFSGQNGHPERPRDLPKVTQWTDKPKSPDSVLNVFVFPVPPPACNPFHTTLPILVELPQSGQRDAMGTGPRQGQGASMEQTPNKPTQALTVAALTAGQYQLSPFLKFML